MSHRVTFFFDGADISVTLDTEPAQIAEEVDHAWNSSDGQMLAVATPEGAMLINLSKVRAVQIR